jgi:hypothetical protein
MIETTKDVEVAGEKYTIKKLTLKDISMLGKFTVNPDERDMEKAASTIANYIFHGTVNPKFESVEQVMELPSEVAYELFFQIMSFNKPAKNFLEELKNM